MTQEHVWRQRFLVLSAVRLLGTLIALLGLAIAFGDIVDVGGNRLLGIALVVVGLVDLAIAPKVLSRRWRDK